MLFNSLQFFIFFIVVLGVYFVLNHKRQNRLLLIASYIFYGVWDWRFLFLIWLSTGLDYFLAGQIYRSSGSSEKRRWISLSIFLNLGILGVFKYFNFFAVNLQNLLSHFHVSVPLSTLEVVLPVGISFYTFQSLSYTIDVYYGRIKPADRFSDFALFVAFFPQLVAGPIERATHLLPQICSPRKSTLEGFYEGCFLIFWGLFEKVYVADNLAKFVDPVFSGPGATSGLEVLTAVYAFAFQIFCDFDGYSNIARGTAQCMGFDIMVNFRWPYFSSNPREFWQRWHISLSTWLRDYLYIPLGGNRGGVLMTCRNLLVTMVLGGLWHGASWTFVLWGLYHGILLVGYRLWQLLLSTHRGWFSSRRSGSDEDSRRSSWKKIVGVFLFFHLVCFGWLIFRSQSLAQAGEMARLLLNGWSMVDASAWGQMIGRLGPYLWILLLVQAVQYRKNDLLAFLRFSLPVRTVFYYVCLVFLIIWGETGAKEFIYFQF